MQNSKPNLTVQKVLRLVSDYKSSGSGYMAVCPAHDDSTPSLSINEAKDGRLLMKCFAGCCFEKILEALHERRKEMKTMKKPPLTAMPEPENEPNSIRLDKFEEIADVIIKGYLKDDGRLVHVENDGFYLYIHEEGYYRPLSKLNLQSAIREAVKVVNVRRHELIATTKTLIENVTIALQNLIRYELPEIVMNADRYTLNLKNGLLDLRTMTLRPHSEAFFSTVQLQVEYDHEANCSIWKKSLREIFANDPSKVRREKTKMLQMFFGLCLTVDTRFQKILILLGDGANGKSLIIGIVQQVIGEVNCSSLSMSQLAEKFNLYRLHGKLANFSTEIQSSGIVPDEVLKKISGEDWVEAERKFREPLRFRPFSKLAFAMNDMPVVTDRSHAFYRRLLIVEFTRIFEEMEQDHQLAEKLKTELNGIFLWMLDGLKELWEQGKFDEGETGKEAVRKFKRENNNIISFTEDWCRLVQGATCLKDTMYRLYVLWCERNGSKPFTQNRFARMLKSCFSKISDGRITRGARVWIGIEFNETAPAGFRKSALTKDKVKVKIKRRPK